MAFLPINGVDLYHEQAGTGDPVLVLVHGNVASARWWEPVWSSLTARYTCIRVDLRGNGRSACPGEGYNVPQYSRDVRALLQALGHERVVVVGHSMGGAVAMDLAVQAPELVQGMVLLNSAPIDGLVTPEERKPLIEQMIRDRNLMKMALAAVMPTAATGAFFEQLVDDAMVAGPTVISNYTSISELDYRAALADTQVPTLILYGLLDGLISLDMMERTRDSIPNAELRIYEDIGHSPNVEAPDRLVADLITFLERR